MAGKNIIELTDSNFEEEVLSSEKPVLVDFWAEWCIPCRMIAPVVDELAKEYGTKVKIAKLDVDKYPKITSSNGIMSIPTLMLYKDGEVVTRLIGYQTKEKLISMIEENI
ncbi:MAG: thioredoxin 1 [Clostridia bacterium]|nr:thioredoxin 1 [Clostridia bacterium]